MNDDYDYNRVIIEMGEILTGVVNACRGLPPDDCSWSTHDAAELAGKAAAVANALIAATAPGRTDAAVMALGRATQEWRAVQADTFRQAAEMIALRDNPEALNP